MEAVRPAVVHRGESAFRTDFSDVSSGKRLAPVDPGDVLRRDFTEPLGISRYRDAAYSGSVSPDPPISLGRSFIFGRPSLMRRTVS